MKKITLLLFGAVLALTTAAQMPITVDRADFAVAGDTIRYDVDSAANAGFDLSDTARYNVTWDFINSFDRDDVTLMRFDDQTTAPSLSFPAGSNMVSYFNGNTAEATFMEVNASGAKVIIMNTFDPSGTDELGRIQFISFPATFGTETRDSFTATRTYHKNDLGFGSFPIIDSIRVTATVKSVFKMDAYGTLMLRSGTYNTLRQNGRLVVSPVVEGRNPFTGSYSVLPIDIGDQDQRNIAWIGTSSKFDYANVVVDTNDAPVEIRYRYMPFPAGLAEQDLAKGFFFAPNPAEGKLFVANQTGAVLHVNLLAIDGKVVQSWELNEGSQEITTDAPAGIYFLQYQEAGGLQSKKIILK